MSSTDFAALPVATKAYFPVAVTLDKLVKWYWLTKTLNVVSSNSISSTIGAVTRIGTDSFTGPIDDKDPPGPGATAAPTIVYRLDPTLSSQPKSLGTRSPALRALPNQPPPISENFAIAYDVLGIQTWAGSYIVSGGGGGSSPYEAGCNIDIFRDGFSTDTPPGPGKCIYLTDTKQYYPQMLLDTFASPNVGPFSFIWSSQQVAGWVQNGHATFDDIVVPMGYVPQAGTSYTGSLTVTLGLWDA